MDFEAGNLLIEGNNYTVQSKRRFFAYASVLQKDKYDCFDFAYDMSFGERGEHRDSRSGGKMHRTKGQIFINAFQGKLAEFALHRFLEHHNIETEKPDLEKYDLGRWDHFDLQCQGKHISVKSTKAYGNLLLLETKDWNENGEYIPNLSSGSAKYDYTVLVRLEPNGEELLKPGNLLYMKDEDINENIKEILFERVYRKNWRYDFPGFIYHSELVKLIRDKRIIPQKAMLNGKTPMDAENYYFQAGNMHPIEELFTPNFEESIDDKKSLRLQRTCPECGEWLRVRKGQYSYFWGCDGFFKPHKCTYREFLKRL